jgi:hypothetical protein
MKASRLRLAFMVVDSHQFEALKETYQPLQPAYPVVEEIPCQSQNQS